MRPAAPGSIWVAALALLSSVGVSACKRGAHADRPLAKAAADSSWDNVPVPAADGPKLWVLRDGTAVVEKPIAGARMIGELRTGSAVARSDRPYGDDGCDGGWFAVRPRGFVCAGPAATTTPVAQMLPSPPALERALPYRYGRARTEGVPVYARIPTAAEQQTEETDLAKHLVGRAAAAETEPLGTGANDVPLDPRGVPTGPPVLLPTGEGVSGGGKRTGGSFFVFSPDASMVPMGQPGDLKLAALTRSSGVAVASSVVAAGPSGPRRFAILADGRVVPTDRLKPALGTSFSGVDLEKVGLPIAFVLKLGVHTWNVEKGEAKKTDDEVERRSFVPLTGKFRTVHGVRFEQTREGTWMRSQDLVPVVKRAKFPDFAVGRQKWLDVSLANQTLTAYEGRKAIYATLVSTGRDQIGDPATTASTVRGAFRVRAKYVTRGVDSREVAQSFDVADAPWVMEFEAGYSVTGTYWSDIVGEAIGYHNVAMSPIDARRIWSWADPQLPEGWSGVLDTGAETTMVNVRP